MGLPTPIFPLSNHCSVVYNDTLYVYSPAGFQALGLTEGSEWKALPMDISLTGAQCVKAIPSDDPKTAQLYVVGGSPNATAAEWNYPGLMHYTFATQKWDWVRPESWVTQNRQNHAAVYLNASQSLLVYSGSQSTTNAGPSSETFLISTVEPFTVRSSPSNGAPPSVKPMLMPWDLDTAVMIGGGATNQAVFTFNGDAGWQDLGVTLTAPIANQDTTQCTVVLGDDGSKVLETFDMSVTPNKVTRVALLNAGGTPAAPGTTVGDKTKRVTIADWPKYNGTLAPTATRAGYSIAQDDKGVAVITGGSEEDPLCIFDQKANSWVNATELFAGQQVVIQSTPSSTASATATLPLSTTSSLAAATSSAVAAVPVTNTSNKNRMLTVLGATLGAIFGIAAILILLLLCLKYRKAKNKKNQQSGYIEKDRLSFADRGAEFMSEAGGSVGQNYSASQNGSHTSLAIISGAKTNHKRGLGSDASTAGLVHKKSPLGYTEPVELSKFDLKPAPIEERLVRQNSGARPIQKALGRSRSSGWSKYFANNEATNLANMPSQRSTYASERSSTNSQSMYTDSRMYSQPSQAPPPLDIPKFDKFEGQRLSRVATGSPTLGNSTDNLPHQPMQAELARANSNGSTHSGISRDDHYVRDPVESWTPMGNQTYDRTSSNYTGSVVIDNNRDATSSYYADGTSSFYPKSNYSSFYPGQPPPLGLPQDRESTVTMFPRGVPDKRGTGNDQQDMSWLNLGAGK